MKAKVLIGGWVYGDRDLKPGDDVTASEAQVEAWEKDGYVKRLPLERQPRAEAATKAPPPEDAAERTEAAERELPPWNMKLTPTEYLQRFPDGPKAALAKLHVKHGGGDGE